MRAGRCAFPPLRDDKQVRLSELEVICYAILPILFIAHGCRPRWVCARRGGYRNIDNRFSGRSRAGDCFSHAHRDSARSITCESVRGPQSTIYGPRALAGVIQIFTKQGEGEPGFTLSAEGGSYDTFREALQSDGKIGTVDYSLGASRVDTDNARPNNQYRNTAGLANLGWWPNEQ